MKKWILTFLMISFTATAQNMMVTAKKGITFTGNMAAKFEAIMNRVEKVNGKTWICFVEPGTYFIGETVAIVDGFPVPYEMNGKEVKVKVKKLDLWQIDFKTKKKTKVKNGSLKDCHGYPKNAKEKIEKIKERGGHGNLRSPPEKAGERNS